MMSRCRLVVRTLTFAGLVTQFVVGGATAGSVEPETLIRSLAPIAAFAQDGASFAWCSDGILYLQRGDGPGRIRSMYDRNAPCGNVLALANRRLLWNTWSGSLSTIRATLVTAAPGTHVVSAGDLVWSKDVRGDLPIRIVGSGRTLAFLDADQGGEGRDTRRGVVRIVGERALRVPGTRFASDLAVTGTALATIATLPAGCVCNDSARWSPDGTRIGFSSHRDGNGELYTIGPDGTDLRRLTSTVDDERLVGWSFDGSKLAFIRSAGGQTNLMVANADGTAARVVAAASDASWSPVRRQLVYLGNRGISVVNDDGTGNRRVVSRGDAPTWSPDGRRLAFTGDVLLRTVSVDGTAATPVPGTNDARSASWSPDGSRIAYASGEGVFVVELATAAVRHVLTSNGVDYTAPRWSPDGSRLLVTQFVADEGARVFVVAADGSGERRLRQGTAEENDASWSPDGSSVAFTAVIQIDQARLSEIAAVRADGSGSRQLTETRAAPDRTLAEVRDVRSGAPRFTVDVGSATGVVLSTVFLGVISPAPLRLRLYNVRSGKPVRVVALPRDASTFSISASRVIFRTGREIRMLDGRTARMRMLAVAQGSPTGLSIAGDRVAWAENSAGHARIRAIVVPPG